jgi:hypothetical protein
MLGLVAREELLGFILLFGVERLVSLGRDIDGRSMDRMLCLRLTGRTMGSVAEEEGGVRLCL